MLRFAALAVVSLLVTVGGCASDAVRPQRTCFHVDESIENDIGFCQALRVGNMLYISGVPAQGEMPVAVRSVYVRLEQILDANGLSFANVVKENVFARDLGAFIEAKAVRKEFYGESFPAATWVQVQRLYLPSFSVEIELVAEYPQ